MRCVLHRTAPIIFSFLGLLSLQIRAQAAGDGKTKPDELVIKVYRVSNLVEAAPNYPYRGTFLPAKGSIEGFAERVMGGGMGGGMGGMGGGMFQVPDRLAQARVVSGGGIVSGQGNTDGTGRDSRINPMRITMAKLIETITSVVDPESWELVGAPGTIQPIGGMLAVNQTPAVHAKILQFLQMLEQESGTLQTLTIDAYWLVLSTEQLEQLRKNRESGSFAVKREALAALVANPRTYTSRINCMNGQTVHVTSGRLESLMMGAIPVVGGSNPAYQPIVIMPQFGLLLELTPSVLPHEEGVLMDLHSSVTLENKPSLPVRLGSSDETKKSDLAVVQIDRPNFVAEQFATTVRIPLATPVLVGGMTFPSQVGATDDSHYLVIEVHAGQKAANGK